MDVHWTAEDPYASADEMFERVDEDEEFWVFTGGTHPPFLTWAENVMGRAAHDYFGHYTHELDFSVAGEYGVWRATLPRYPATTYRILFSEIVAQRCAAAYLDDGSADDRFGQRAFPAPDRWLRWTRQVFGDA